MISVEISCRAMIGCGRVCYRIESGVVMRRSGEWDDLCLALIDRCYLSAYRQPDRERMTLRAAVAIALRGNKGILYMQARQPTF